MYKTLDSALLRACIDTNCAIQFVIAVNPMHGCKPICPKLFRSQFSDDEMRMMDAPFQALDMFPGSMHRLLSYENMLSGVLTDSQDEEANPDHNEMDTMDTCGFPLFSHELQDDPSNADGSLGTLVNPSNSKVKYVLAHVVLYLCICWMIY
jgi:hypothetical protein